MATPASEVYQEAVKTTVEHFGISESLLNEILDARYAGKPLDSGAALVFAFYTETVTVCARKVNFDINKDADAAKGKSGGGKKKTTGNRRGSVRNSRSRKRN